jgi:hypothetical protein
VMISTRSVGLVIDTVVCLTLDKWETVSGQFGGYLRGPHGSMPDYGFGRCDGHHKRMIWAGSGLGIGPPTFSYEVFGTE